ncbi:AI-2E family transporter [Kocuria dechangensis]|uniref:AI-2E family transporter n=1 Tax=Kocuria dechangensis TaxID=1176249 RepID=A0A917LW15_9MICC|nr:AI-2E family transporter [Kocuria dechangensis]GGG58797.1 AI-2E family transporter [Kocuria dechangensis]
MAGSHARSGWRESGLWADALGRASIRAAQMLIVLAAAVVVVYALVQLKLVVIPLTIALILTATLNPVVGFLRRRGVPPTLATWITFLATLLALGGVVTGIVFSVRGEWDELVVATVAGLERLREFIIAGPIPLGQQALDDLLSALVDFVSGDRFRAGALLGISAAAEVFAGILLGAVILFFFLKDGARIWFFLLRPFHGDHLDKLLLSGTTTMQILGNYMRGTAIVALLEAVVIGVTLLVLRVPLALPLAVLIFLGGFVPLVGAALGGVLAALVALVANGPLAALIVVAVVVAINQLDGRVLQPIVMGRALNLHALVILLALAGGAIIAGVVGAVLAVPVTAVAWSVLLIWTRSPQASVEGPPP